jgi:hypothetical protein
MQYSCWRNLDSGRYAGHMLVRPVGQCDSRARERFFGDEVLGIELSEAPEIKVHNFDQISP